MAYGKGPINMGKGPIKKPGKPKPKPMGPKTFDPMAFPMLSGRPVTGLGINPKPVPPVKPGPSPRNNKAKVKKRIIVGPPAKQKPVQPKRPVGR
jgi:hypothetical protein